MNRLLKRTIILILVTAIVALCYAFFAKVEFESKSGEYENIWDKMDSRQKDEWTIFLTEIPKIEPNSSDTDVKMLDYWGDTLYGIELEESWKFTESDECVIENIYSLKNGKFSLNDMYRQEFEKRYGNIKKGTCTYPKDNFIVYEAVKPRYFEDDWESDYYGNIDDSFDRAEWMGVITAEGGALDANVLIRLFDADCIDAILKKHYGVVPNRKKLTSHNESEINRQMISKALKYNCYLFRTSINSMNSMLFMPLATKRFSPEKIYELKDDLYYVEGVQKMWVEAMREEETSNWQGDRYHMIIHRNRIGDDWRVYKWGQGGLTNEQLTKYQ